MAFLRAVSAAGNDAITPSEVDHEVSMKRIISVEPELSGSFGYSAEWEGPRLRVRITADSTTVCTSTDIIGREEFGNSLFRQALEERMSVLPTVDLLSKRQESIGLTPGSARVSLGVVGEASLSVAAAGTAATGLSDSPSPLPAETTSTMTDAIRPDEEYSEAKTSETPCQIMDDRIIDLWFDRNGQTLPVILDAMRGYKMASKVAAMPECEHEMIKTDCHFYRVPLMLDRLFPKRFDHRFMDKSLFRLVESENLLRKTSKTESKWQCVGIADRFSSGRHSVEFKIVKSSGMQLQFGVMDFDLFKLTGSFSDHPGRIGYYAYSGRLYFKGKKMEFAEKAAVGDRILLRVTIAEDRSAAKISFFKNDVKLGSQDLSRYLSLESSMIFAVTMLEKGDIIKIISPQH